MVVLSIKKTCCVVLSMLMPFKTQPERNMCTVLRTIIQWPLIVIEVRHQNKLGLIFVLKNQLKRLAISMQSLNFNGLAQKDIDLVELAEQLAGIAED